MYKYKQLKKHYSNSPTMAPFFSSFSSVPLLQGLHHYWDSGGHVQRKNGNKWALGKFDFLPHFYIPHHSTTFCTEETPTFPCFFKALHG